MLTGRRRRVGPISGAIKMAQCAGPHPVQKQTTRPLFALIQAGGAKLERRFFDKVRREGECHRWSGSKNPTGYGQFKIEGRYYPAHRIALTIANGEELPLDKAVCHHCDNRWCVAPDHLWVGSWRENTIDMHLKGRGFSTAARGGRVIAEHLIPDYVNFKHGRTLT